MRIRDNSNFTRPSPPTRNSPIPLHTISTTPQGRRGRGVFFLSRLISLTFTSDRSSLDSLHEMCCESGDLVPEALAGDDGDFLGDALVGVEIGSQLRVIFLDDDASGLLHRFSTNATHVSKLRGLSFPFTQK